MKLGDLIAKIEFDRRRLEETQAHAASLASSIKKNSVRVFDAVRGDHAIGSSQIDFACGGLQYRVEADGVLTRINDLPAVDAEIELSEDAS